MVVTRSNAHRTGTSNPTRSRERRPAWSVNTVPSLYATVATLQQAMLPAADGFPIISVHRDDASWRARGTQLIEEGGLRIVRECHPPGFGPGISRRN